MLSDPLLQVTKWTLNNTNVTNVNLETHYLFTGLSTLSYLLLITILCVYSYGDGWNIGVYRSSSVIFMCVLTTMVVHMYIGDENTYYIYTLIVMVGFGIAVNFFGCVYFFKAPSSNESSLDFHHASIGMIIWTITVPLTFIEMFFSIGFFYENKYFMVAITATALFQKIIQAGIYYFSLRHKCPVENMHFGASWYLKIIAVFNFSMWIQSIATAGENRNNYMEKILGQGFSILSSTYSALLIDYRLLCCLLYLEHAFEIDHWDEHCSYNSYKRYRSNIPVWNVTEFRINSSQYTGVGCALGLLLISTQFLNGLQYAHIVGPWANIFGILAEFMVIIQGVIIIKLACFSEEEERTWRESDSKGVDMMVGLMGIVALIFMILKAFVTSIWAVRMSSVDDSIHTYLSWTAIKFWSRTVGVGFQLFFFMRITPSIGSRDEVRANKSSYFLLPFMMLSLLSVFINSVIDNYDYIVETFVEEGFLETASLAVYKTGEPLHLGFCLHLFLHFLLINNKLRQMSSVKRDFEPLPVIPEDEKEEDKGFFEKLLNSDGKFHSV